MLKLNYMNVNWNGSDSSDCKFGAWQNNVRTGVAGRQYIH